MARRGKKHIEARKQLDVGKKYELRDALQLVKELSVANFDESIEMAVRLGVNPRHADQMVRGSVVLPHGVGKVPRVLVFAKGEKEREAEEAGADYVGGEDLAQKITEGWTDFDRAAATPDMMAIGSRLTPSSEHLGAARWWQGRDRGQIGRRPLGVGGRPQSPTWWFWSAVSLRRAGIWERRAGLGAGTADSRPEME